MVSPPIASAGTMSSIEPGELKVVAYKNGKKWATDTVKTTGAAANSNSSPTAPTIAGDGHDLSFVTAHRRRQGGSMVPRSRISFTLDIAGPGEIVATDNGDATDLNLFSSPDRKAFNGLALAIVKAKHGQAGPITLTANPTAS